MKLQQTAKNTFGQSFYCIGHEADKNKPSFECYLAVIVFICLLIQYFIFPLTW